MNDENESLPKGKSRRKLVARLLELGISKEIAYRLGELWSYTKKIGGKIVRIGKILLAKIVEFVEQHPYAVSGMALGAAVAAIVSAEIPGIGHILAPIVAFITIPTGAYLGAKIDSEKKSKRKSDSSEVLEELVKLAHDFFKSLIDWLKRLFQPA